VSQAAVVYGREYLCDIGPHVFPVEKYRLIRDALVAAGDLEPDAILAPPMPPREDLLLVHAAEYLDDLDQLRWTPRTQSSELPLLPDIVQAYWFAAGGTTLAARAALERGFGINIGGGFHHAFAERAEGFCYINDLAVAISVLLRDGRITRAAVVDLDVHQGNGTAGIFARDDRVFTLSLHQENNYPVPKQHSTLDVGLADRIDDADYLAALEPALARVWAFGPDIVLYQAGADPYRDDLLGGLSLTVDGLATRDARVLEGCAARGIPAVVTLGGGYARNRDDTVRIQAATCRMAIRLAAARAAGHAS
jgi:acetoin utilization deacetylase AcuC-like enzyme